MKTTILQRIRVGLLGLAAWSFAGAAAAAEPSERDYFDELPTVLTVSRLAQPINETPGAVTIIDRETIRRSGARELADVLRLVPGYLVGGYNGANPGVAYHAPIDELGARNLVLVDGRSIYSTYYQGDTHKGMMGLLLEDIERIEVLRGSNSAAYGANAMFGVINIITRNTADTHGVELSVTGGAGGIKDNYARLGWGNESASFRISAGRRGDSGYGNAHDDKIVSQLALRGDLRPTADQEVMLAAGVTEIASGEGFPLGSAYNPIGGNALRTATTHNAFLHGSWLRQLSDTDQIKLSANFTEETLKDSFQYVFPPVTISSSGRGRRANVEFQHQVGISEGLRAVWGAGYKYEEARSVPLYNTNDPVSFHEERLFGNLEWRPHAQWLINAGGFLGKHNQVGSYYSPRLMANFHVLPDHTLRAGVTRSARMPTIFELAADVRYYWNGILIGHTHLADGKLKAETLDTQEVGYFGNFRDWRMTLDIRGYVETMKDGIDRDGSGPANFVNRSAFRVRGIEYQLRWQPWEKTEILVNQAFSRLIRRDDDNRGNHEPPSHATTIALLQKLPWNLDLSLMFHAMGAMTWRNEDTRLPARHRLDVRVAYPFRIGSTRAEAAMTVQAANGSYVEFLPDVPFRFERRAFGTLRLEF
ncbi:MAG: TonB-dependent receptor [Pseudomonadota bacterium]